MKRLLSLCLLALLLTIPVRAAAPELLSADTVPLGEGAELSRELWCFDDGQERQVQCITVDMNAATLLSATPGDESDNDGGGGRGESLADMANAAVQRGKDVLAAINGDFYKTSADGASQYASYAALGVLVKDGELLSRGQQTLGAMYLGVTREGAAFMGSAEPDGDWDKVSDSLLTAVGGELWLIRHGENNLASLRWRTDSPILSARYGSAGQVYDAAGRLSDTLTAYPRTAAGILPDGRVLLLCASVGGVTPGLTVAQLTELLLAKGCVEAMNLDGGPSSQLLLPTDSVFYPSEVKGVSQRLGTGLLVASGRGEAALAQLHDAAPAPRTRSFDSRLVLSVVIGVAIYFLFTRFAMPSRQRRR